MSLFAFSSGAQIMTSGNWGEPSIPYSSPIIARSPDHIAYKISYPPGYRMRNVGRTLTIAGGALFIGGFIVYNNADKNVYTYQTSTGTVNEIDPKAALGVLMIVGGTGMTVPGIILWAKGSRKFNRYLERETACVINGTTISVRYRF